MLYEVSSNDVWGHGFVMSAKMRVNGFVLSVKMRAKMLAILQKPFKNLPRPRKAQKWHKKVQKMSKISGFFFCKWGGIS